MYSLSFNSTQTNVNKLIRILYDMFDGNLVHTVIKMYPYLYSCNTHLITYTSTHLIAHEKKLTK